MLNIYIYIIDMVNKNMKHRLSKYDKIFMVLMITSIVIISGTITYAFYQSSISGTVSWTLARWSFTANNQTDSFNIDLGAGYPGKKDVYDLELSAVNSDLDVYYEVFIVNKYEQNGIAYSTLFWDDNYTKRIGRCSNISPFGGIYGIYGTISKGTIEAVKLYYNFSYENYESFITDRDQYTIQIKAQQKTGYSGSIPMKLFGSNYTYESIDSTSGYIKGEC